MLANPFDEGGSFSIQSGTKLTLMPLSGGLDSTYLLKKLLRETDDQLVVFHLTMANREGRELVEKQAVTAIAQYCISEFRPFSLIGIGLDRRQVSSFGMDMQTVAFYSGLIQRQFSERYGRTFDQFYMGGWAIEDNIDPIPQNDGEDRRQLIIDHGQAGRGFTSRPELKIHDIVSKREQAEYLGPELVRLCWTCRTPTRDEQGNHTECGTCKTCEQMEPVRAALGDDFLPEWVGAEAVS